MTSAAVVVALLVLGASLEDDTSYQEGLKLVEDFENEKAIFRFQEALDTEGRTDAERVVVLQTMGNAYAEIGDFVRAVATYEMALAFDPLLSPAAGSSPKILELVDEARRNVRAKAAAVPEPASAPAPVQPAAEPAAPVAPVAPVTASAADEAEPGGTPFLAYGAGGVGGLSAAIFLGGAAAWGGGIALWAMGNGSQYQDEAVALQLPSAVAQYSGQAGVVGGALGLTVGAGLLVASLATGELF